ncbi:MAG: hydroxysqualene dehydroxylase HpnE [Planctomycetales bacterium]
MREFRPGALHLALSFARLSYLSLSEKLALGRGLKALCRWRPESGTEKTFAAWLKEAKQPQAVIDRFWQVVLTSALSESLDRIEVSQGRKVFVDGFLASRDGWKMQVPTVPLGELYGEHLREWLERQGVAIRLQAGVAEVLEAEGRVQKVLLRNGEEIAADAVILAVPQNLAASLLETNSAAQPICEMGSKLETAPISSVHLWFDRAVTPLPHAVLVDRLSQWMFARGEATGKLQGHYYQVVISASRGLRGEDQKEIIAQVVAELGEIWPAARVAKLLHSRVVTEHNAVFAVQPGADAMRPAQATPVANLFLAGDWTQTGWPATMEGAVRSGYLAAEAFLRRQGEKVSLVQPDLPVSWWSRVLLGI